MSKYRVLLADSSYTIRRIVELSFSEESDIELITFESGTPLREKLLELTPYVVLVDIRLPEFNGYQVCKFVNESDALAHTRVFLLKGGFEPVNEELLKELKYQEIITKPFDSNALVKTVKDILEEGRPQTAPPPGKEDEISDSFPEDLPEISGFEDEAVEGINFADVSEDVSSEQAPGTAQKSDTSDTDDFIRDEVVPSEEITQGAQPDRDDSLKPDDNADDIPNPFQENSRESDIDELLEREIERERQTHEDEPDFGVPQTDEFRFDSAEPADPFEKEAKDSETGLAEVEPEPASTDDIAPGGESPREPGASDTLSEAELAQAFAEAPEPRQRDDIFAPSDTAESDSEIPPPIPEPEMPSEPEPSASPETEPSFQTDTVEPVYSIDADTDAERMLESLDNLSAKADLQETTAAAGAVQRERESPPREEAVDPQQLTSRLEDKLSVAVKEILWEVVPPLAERIIKEEIRRLESEVESSET